MGAQPGQGLQQKPIRPPSHTGFSVDDREADRTPSNPHPVSSRGTHPTRNLGPRVRQKIFYDPYDLSDWTILSLYLSGNKTHRHTQYLMITVFLIQKMIMWGKVGVLVRVDIVPKRSQIQ
jgi:hypothetical protein